MCNHEVIKWKACSCVFRDYKWPCYREFVFNLKCKAGITYDLEELDGSCLKCQEEYLLTGGDDWLYDAYD